MTGGPDIRDDVTTRLAAMKAALQRRRWRRLGYRIASDADIAPGVVIEGEDVEIAAGVKLRAGTLLKGKRIRIGRRVEIGPNVDVKCPDIAIGDESAIRKNVTIAGLLLPESKLDIGRRVRVFQDAFLNPSMPLTIGDETGIGGRCLIFTHGAWQSILEGFPVTFAPVTFGRNVWLPWQVFILPGVEIGDNVTIAAGSIVNRSVPANSLAAGMPARVLKGPPDWPPAIQPEEQWTIAQRVFRDLGRQLESDGEAVETVEGDDVLTVRCRRGAAALVRDARAAAPVDATVVAALHGRPDTADGVTWLALLERERSGGGSAFAEEVAEYVSRFGLRFQRVDER